MKTKTTRQRRSHAKTNPRIKVTVSRSSNSTNRRRKNTMNPTARMEKLTDRVVDLAQGAVEQVGEFVKSTTNMIAGAGDKVRRTVSRRVKS